MKDVIIIGSGIAGTTAAIYCKRANLDVLVIEQELPGGQISETTTIDNYPGLYGITGPELSERLQIHLDALNIDVEYNQVIKLEKNKKVFILTLANKQVIESKSVIIATGARPRRLYIQNEENLIGHGIGFCATCDGAFAKDKEVAIVGGGNSAITEALYLSNIASKVYIIQNLPELTCNAHLKEQVLSLSNIEVIYNSKITSLLGDRKLETIIIERETESLKEQILLDISNLFICIGREPNIDLVKDLVKLSNGYIKTNNDMKTSLNGLYAVGDVRDKKLRQMITAASDGAIAANSVIEYLRNK